MSPLRIRPLLTPAKVAQRAGVSLATVYHAIHRGRLEAFRAGRGLRIEAEAAETFARGRR